MRDLVPFAQFEDISSSLSIIVNQYENIFVAGEFNVDLLNPKCDSEKSFFFDLRDAFALPNLVEHKTCCTNKNNTLLDVLLTTVCRAVSRFE